MNNCLAWSLGLDYGAPALPGAEQHCICLSGCLTHWNMKGIPEIELDTGYLLVNTHRVGWFRQPFIQQDVLSDKSTFVEVSK